MGGTVTVGFRFSDGTRRVQHRWTNALPQLAHDVRTLSEDRTFIEGYLDSEEDGDGGEKPLAPHDYGLVFLDFKAGLLLSSQDYTLFGSIDPIQFIVLAKNIRREGVEDNIEDIQRYQALLESGKLNRTIRRWRMVDGEYIAYPYSHERLACDFDELLAMGREFEDINDAAWNAYDKAGDAPREYLEFGVDTSPLKVEEFRDKPVADLRARIMELGIPLTAEDMTAWDRAEHEHAKPI